MSPFISLLFLVLCSLLASGQELEQSQDGDGVWNFQWNLDDLWNSEEEVDEDNWETPEGPPELPEVPPEDDSPTPPEVPENPPEQPEIPETPEKPQLPLCPTIQTDIHETNCYANRTAVCNPYVTQPFHCYSSIDDSSCQKTLSFIDCPAEVGNYKMEPKCYPMYKWTRMANVLIHKMIQQYPSLCYAI